MKRLWLLLGCMAAPAFAQETDHVPSSAAAFLERARVGTERYQDVNTAIADGYRPLGPDAPAMGVHWVHPRLALRGIVDAAQPAILTYVTIGGRLVLAGTGYVVPLGPDEDPPERPAGRQAWHFHSRSVIQESVAPGRHTPNAKHEGPRVAVLHAWVWMENPAGPFVPENWALPYHRLSLPVPPGAPTDAARSFALLTEEGMEYYVDQLRLAGADGDGRAQAVFRKHEARISEWFRAHGAAPLDEEDVAWLADRWWELSAEIAALPRG